MFTTINSEPRDSTDVELISTHGRVELQLPVPHHSFAPSLINCTLNFHNPAGLGGNFGLGTRSTNSPSHVHLVSAPPDSSLDLSIVTQGGTSGLVLPATFEGTYNAVGSPASVIVSPNVSDPLGQSRTRDIQRRLGPGHASGYVRWIPQRHGLLSKVNVVADRAATIQL
jgi:hypothetical protein